MPFCPICKNEYRAGFKECHECKVPLVDSLEDQAENEDLKKPVKFFDVNDERSYEFLDRYKEQEEEERESEIVSYDEITFKERPSDVDEDSGNDDDLMMIPSVSEQMLRQRMLAESMKKPSVYIDKKQKVSDYKSSGCVLLFVGSMGIAALVLLYVGVIPGFSGFKSNYMLMGVMLIMFLAFIISGILSFAQIKSIIQEAEADDDAMKRVKNFMDEHLTVERIAKDVVIGRSDTEEEQYFKRTEYMTRILIQNFPELEHALIETLIDERYTELYEDNNH